MHAGLPGHTADPALALGALRGAAALLTRSSSLVPICTRRILRALFAPTTSRSPERLCGSRT